ncbi:hypothetical protein HDU87_002566 [Geranomyces variabilis]|uniref:DNA (cytosine-5-)-methyltransferase n=1 Tax=Geranomyces variabilis TaxID=109894 RepID=A0AAD5XTT4_9FUNG|nr:hypothetical protein HDU87_002566 [Geranomyces variabilis]
MDWTQHCSLKQTPPTLVELSTDGTPLLSKADITGAFVDALNEKPSLTSAILAAGAVSPPEAARDEIAADCTDLQLAVAPAAKPLSSADVACAIVDAFDGEHSLYLTQPAGDNCDGLDVLEVAGRPCFPAQSSLSLIEKHIERANDDAVVVPESGSLSNAPLLSDSTGHPPPATVLDLLEMQGARVYGETYPALISRIASEDPVQTPPALIDPRANFDDRTHGAPSNPQSLPSLSDADAKDMPVVLDALGGSEQSSAALMEPRAGFDSDNRQAPSEPDSSSPLSNIDCGRGLLPEPNEHRSPAAPLEPRASTDPQSLPLLSNAQCQKHFLLEPSALEDCERTPLTSVEPKESTGDETQEPPPDSESLPSQSNADSQQHILLEPNARRSREQSPLAVIEPKSSTNDKTLELPSDPEDLPLLSNADCAPGDLEQSPPALKEPTGSINSHIQGAPSLMRWLASSADWQSDSLNIELRANTDDQSEEPFSDPQALPSLSNSASQNDLLLEQFALTGNELSPPVLIEPATSLEDETRRPPSDPQSLSSLLHADCLEDVTPQPNSLGGREQTIPILIDLTEESCDYEPQRAHSNLHGFPPLPTADCGKDPSLEPSSQSFIDLTDCPDDEPLVVPMDVNDTVEELANILDPVLDSTKTTQLRAARTESLELFVSNDEERPIDTRDAEQFSEDDVNSRCPGVPEPALLFGETARQLGDKTLPVRQITSFRMCDDSERLVGPACLDEGLTCWMSGSVQPRTSEGDVLDCAPVEFTFEVQDWQPYHVETGHPETWVKSPAAWYILDKPAPEYESIYKTAQTLDALIAHTINAIADFPLVEYDDFVKSTELSLAVPHGSLNATIEENVNEILFEVDNWFKNSSLQSKLWEYLADMQPSAAYSNHRRPRFARSKATNELVLKNRNVSFVTPSVAKVAKIFFDVQGLDDDDILETDRRLEPVVVQPERSDYTQSVEWTSTYYSTFRRGPGLPDKDYYKAAIIDGITYECDDFVYVRGEDSEEPWFGQICYFFQYDRSGEKHQAHVRWLTHGKNTMLAETASRAELMTVDLCDDVFLENVSGKPIVRVLGRDDKEPSPDDGNFFIRYQYEEDTGTFSDMPLESNASRDEFAGDEDCCVACRRKEAARLADRCLWKTANGERFVEYQGIQYKKGDFVYLISEPNQPYGIAQIQEFVETRDKVPGNKAAATKRKRSTKEEDSDDDILSSEVYDAHVRFRLFARCDEVLSPSNRGTSPVGADSEGEETDELPDPAEEAIAVTSADNRERDDRRLFMTDFFGSLHIQRLEGLCWIEHVDDIADLNRYREGDDQFYFSEKIGRSMLASTVTPAARNVIVARQDRREERAHAQADYDALMAQPKLVALDIFAGAGGLTCGFDSTGFIETKHAVEFASSAGLTFKENFPNATVHIKCVNTLLERAVRIQERGEVLAPIRDEAGHIMPELPSKDSIDFIYCGPSCQGFSHLNRFRLRVNDIKNTLIAASLSYVEFFRPKYFLLENVRGLTDFELGGVLDGDKLSGGIQLGVVKLIVKTLHALNYQTRFGLLQAANHGLPQSRTRFFVWGAKRGLTLPELPQPTHCASHRGRLKLSLNGYDGPTTYDPRKRTLGNSPLPGVTVWDAISDLPQWEYTDPDAVRRKRKSTCYVPDGNGATDFPHFKQEVAKGHCGPDPQPYTLPPLSNYQRLMRRGCEEVRNHYTRSLSENTVRLMCNIPRIRGACALHLPDSLRATVSAAAQLKSYGRVYEDRQHPAVLTEQNAQGKHGRVLHPYQNRMLSVRELARIQGFPDRFIFRADKTRKGQEQARLMVRQIGNAVPPPLAAALGKKLMHAMLTDAKAQEVSPAFDKNTEPLVPLNANSPPRSKTPPAYQSPKPRTEVVVEIPSRRSSGRFQRAPTPPPAPPRGRHGSPDSHLNRPRRGASAFSQ